MMDVSDLRKAVSEANRTLRAADEIANDCAEILSGRLKHVSSYKLRRLKRELANYNMHTGRWKS